MPAGGMPLASPRAMRTMCGVLLCATLSACSSDGGGASNTGGDNGLGAAGAAGDDSQGGAAAVAGTAGDDSQGGAMAVAGAAGEGGTVGLSLPIWNDDSASLRVVSGSFFEGYFRYERERAQLSAAQLSALEEIRTAPDLDDCIADGTETQLTVTDSFGKPQNYRNASCDPSSKALEPNSTAHFLLTLPPCLLSKDDRSQALASAPSVAIGDGCQNGLFTSSAAEVLWLRLTVPTANVPVLLELADCGLRTFKLELLSPTGDTVLGTGAPSGDKCQTLTHTFDAAGSYVVRVTLTGGQGAGDFTFSAN